MMLLVACGIDANDKVVPIAWALVPIENEVWWTWFLGYLKHCISTLESEDYIFISDREKGMATIVSTVFDKSINLHCCQHIADNVVASYRNKCRSLFWACARAKTKVAFQSALEALKKENAHAGEYVDNIPHNTWTRYILTTYIN